MRLVRFKKIDTANNGQDGLQVMADKLNKCCQQPYSVIFVDLNMPVLNGLQMME